MTAVVPDCLGMLEEVSRSILTTVGFLGMVTVTKSSGMWIASMLASCCFAWLALSQPPPSHAQNTAWFKSLIAVV